MTASYVMYFCQDVLGLSAAFVGLMVYFTVVYILWGVACTMMDIPCWSMIPAVTKSRRIGKTCP